MRAANTHNTKAGAVCVLLVLLVLAVFGQTAHFGFVNYDDDKNVYAEPDRGKRIVHGGGGLGLHPRAGRQLGSADHPFPHAGLPALRDQRRRTSFGQCPPARRDGGAAVSGVAADDREPVAQRLCGGGVRRPSVAGGIGGLGLRTQGCVERPILRADHRGLCPQRAPAILGRPDCGDCCFLPWDF